MNEIPYQGREPRFIQSCTKEKDHLFNQFLMTVGEKIMFVDASEAASNPRLNDKRNGPHLGLVVRMRHENWRPQKIGEDPEDLAGSR